MATDDYGRISRPSALSKKERERIGDITSACEAVDGRAFPLMLGPPVMHFLCVLADRPVGYMEFLHSDYMVEAWGMVHPEFRRRGVGSALLNALKEECRAKGSAEFILACDRSLESGRGFADASGAVYINSEHRMALDRSRFSPGMKRRLEIRAGSADDVDDFVSVTVAAYGERREEFERRKKTAQKMYAEPNRMFYVAYIDGQPVGTIATLSVEDESQVFINALGVVAEHQGQGYGREILGRSVERLLRERWEKITIEVYSDKNGAHHLYESCGFVDTLTFDYYRVSAAPRTE